MSNWQQIVRLSTFIAIFTIFILVSGGCYSPPPRIDLIAQYDVALVEVEHSSNADAETADDGEAGALSQPDGSSFVYKDDIMKIVFEITGSRINLSLTNQFAFSLVLLWNRASFIDLDGTASRVAHSGVKYVDRNEEQPPTVVPKGTTLSDFALPTNRVYYREGTYGRYISIPGGWEELPIVLPKTRSVHPEDAEAREAFRENVQAQNGKRFGLLLPFEIGKDVREYTFWFQVQGATVGSD